MHIFVIFMGKEPSTKFCGVLIIFGEAIKLKTFELDAIDAIPTNARNILPFLCIFRNFMEKELYTKIYHEVIKLRSFERLDGVWTSMMSSLRMDIIIC